MQRTKENLNNKCHGSKCNLRPAVGMIRYSQHVSLSFFYSLECFLSAIIIQPAVFQLTFSKWKQVFEDTLLSQKHVLDLMKYAFDIMYYL